MWPGEICSRIARRDSSSYRDPLRVGERFGDLSLVHICDESFPTGSYQHRRLTAFLSSF